MKKVYIINGAAGVGKDTFVEIAKYFFFLHGALTTFNISSVDKVKEAAILLGWDEIKDEKGRKFLSDLKDISTENYEGPYHYMLNKINSKNEGIFFLHIRENQEIKKFVERNPDTKTIAVIRDNVTTYNNHADKNAYDYDYDIIINNLSSIQDLTILVENFVKEELGI